MPIGRFFVWTFPKSGDISLEDIMEKVKKAHYFTAAELALWMGSLALIVAAFCIWDRVNFLTLAASLLGVTSLIFCAKGNPAGQALIIVFAVLYGIISWRVAYYGEMITYVGMSAPMAVWALIAWLRHPYRGKKSEVRVNELRGREWALLVLITAAVTAAFYFILRALNTANLIPSTVSVTTSFLAVYLTARRSPFYALAYAANDGVLIVLWSLMAAEDITCLSVVICFCVFFVNDLYGFFNWSRMRRRQRAGDGENS